MRKVLFWLADLFGIDLTTEVVKVVEKEVYLSQSVKGDVKIQGNLVIDGSLEVSGGITCYKEKL